MARSADPARRNLAERDLPGIGKAYSLETLDGARLLTVVHQSSRRDVYVTPPGAEEPVVSVTLSDDQAREFGAALAGAFFKPVALAQVEAVVDGLLIDWVTLRDDSPGAGRTIAELEIRRRTRMTTPGIALVESPDELGLLATFGLVMLLFHLGLEFSVHELLGGGVRLATAGAVFLGLNVLAGIGLGFAFGWGDREALVIAGAVAISSSAIVTKLLTELRRLANSETPLILGIIVVEDVFLALYLAVVQPILSDASGTEILVSIASAFGFLLGFALIARFAAGLVGRLIDAESDELLIVCVVGLVVLAAGVAEEVGVSDAIAALLIGLVVAPGTCWCFRSSPRCSPPIPIVSPGCSGITVPDP